LHQLSERFRSTEKPFTAFVQSAAWGTRLRYVLSERLGALAAELGAPIGVVKVKVRAKPR